MTTYRIVKRAYSEYTLAEKFDGTYMEALNRADELQNANRDGEYMVRRTDRDWFPTTAYRSGMDYL